MSATFSLALLKFSNWLQSAETHPSICFCFVATLSFHQALLFCPSADPTALIVAQEQDLIGWENFLLGQVSLQWSSILEQHLQSHNSWHSIKAWETSMVKQLLSISMPCGPAAMVFFTTVWNQLLGFWRLRPSAPRSRHSLPWNSRTSCLVTNHSCPTNSLPKFFVTPFQPNNSG